MLPPIPTHAFHNKSCPCDKVYFPMQYYYRKKIQKKNISWNIVSGKFELGSIYLSNNVSAFKRRWLKYESPETVKSMKFSSISSDITTWPKKIAKNYLKWLGFTTEEQKKYLNLAKTNPRSKRKRECNLAILAEVGNELYLKMTYEEKRSNKKSFT